MLAHAFDTLGLHRVGLTVFAFNERAIRSYRKVGFLVEGHAREAIWRDGRYWDEVAMSILEPEWRAIEAARTAVQVAPAAASPAAGLPSAGSSAGLPSAGSSPSTESPSAAPAAR